MGTNLQSLPFISGRAWRRTLLWLLAAFVLAGVVTPWVDASHWSAPLQRSLEEALGRKVSFEEVHFTLFTGPGVTLGKVTLGEDPRYGLEPFAYVPTLQVRLRPDKLLLGQILVSSLRLVGPSLNLVKRSDGNWNVLELVRRLGGPRRSPLHLFPFFEVVDGRIDFKFGTHKTPLYLLDAGISVYPERSGALTLHFSGAPARTDRAGNGFGHFRGDVTWRLNPTGKEDALQADVNLEPSNLSELTTLIEGQDAGVHGMVSSHLVATGPLNQLRLQGSLHFDDLHRWDLLPVSGQYWNIRYGGRADLLTNQLAVETWGKEVGSEKSENTPLSLALEVNHFLTRPVWTVTARMSAVPLANVLPLGRRMGLNLPADLTVKGAVDGEITLSSETGSRGAATVRSVSVTLPNMPTLNAEAVNATVREDRVHFEPTDLQTGAGHLRMGGDFFLMTPRANALIEAQNFSVADLKAEISPWLGMPSCFDLFHDGELTGDLSYARDEGNAGVWSGRLQLSNASVKIPGVAKPLRKSEGRISFKGDDLDVTRFSGFLGERALRATYRYSPGARHPEHLRVDLPGVAWEDFESLLAPTLEAQNWLARLHMTKRTIPLWLSSRNMEGDLSVNQFAAAGTNLGPLSSHFLWNGTSLEVSNLTLRAAGSVLRADGTVGMASSSPQYSFTAHLSGLRWAGGRLAGDGNVETSGMGKDVLSNLQLAGAFSGTGLTLQPDDTFINSANGDFAFSFADGWPSLKLSNMRADSDEVGWTGAGESKSDGKLVLDLEHDGQQRHIVSSFAGNTAQLSSLDNR